MRYTKYARRLAVYLYATNKGDFDGQQSEVCVCVCLYVCGLMVAAFFFCSQEFPCLQMKTSQQKRYD